MAVPVEKARDRHHRGGRSGDAEAPIYNTDHPGGVFARASTTRNAPISVAWCSASGAGAGMGLLPVIW